MYLNKNVAIMKRKDVNLLFNFTNGVIAGIDNKGLLFLKSVENKTFQYDTLTLEEKNFFDYLLNNEFVFEKPSISSRMPVTAYLHLTNRCNLHCIGCYSFDDRRNKCDDLSTEDILMAIDQLKEAGVQNLIFSGGEPLLRDNILEIVKYAKVNANIANVNLITNGTIFNKKILSDISNYVDTVSVSLDTYKSDMKAFLRDSGIFNKVLRSILWLKETGNNVNIIPTIHHLNSSNLVDYVKLAQKLGVSINFSILSTCFEGELMDYIPNNEDLIRMSDFLSNTDLAISDTSIKDGVLNANNYCGAGTLMIAIGTQGNVYPCHMLMYDEYCIGNIKKSTIKEMREKSLNAKTFLNLNVDKVKGCSKCRFRYLCGGGCRARSQLRYNNVFQKDPYCKLFKNYYEKVIPDVVKR